MKAGNRTTLSLDLQNELTATLERGEQAMLFLNRRGFSTFVFCRECGFVLTCPACEIPLTLHQLGSQRSKLICHHCGRYEQPPECCPKCQGTKIKYLGAGTQQVVDDVTKLFPQARILRVDADSTGAVDSFQQVHEKISGHKVDIIIGTQMIAKGWDIPSVSLVGVILADQSLFFPSFRAGERTFQLLTQVAGRSGRRNDPGRVIIQTYSPDNSYILAARDEAYARFFDEEIKSREAFDYPPFSRFVKLTISHTDEAKAIELCEQLMTTLAGAQDDIQILGPVPAFILKKKDRFYYHIILQGQNPIPLLQSVPGTWTVDVDPIDML
jgi:primosomal protein N' (replication factor Y)